MSRRVRGARSRREAWRRSRAWSRRLDPDLGVPQRTASERRQHGVAWMCALGLFLSFTLPLASRVPPAQAATTTKLIVPVAADAKVRSTAPSTSYGSATTLSVSGVTRTYVLVSISGLFGPTPTKLRLFTQKSSTSAISAYLTDSSWLESTLTWDTAPTITGSPRVQVFPASAGAWTTIPLGSLDNGLYTIALTGAAGSGTSQFSSREGTKAPNLVLSPNDTVPPVVAITQPAMAAALTGTTLLTPTPTDNVRVATVVFYRDTTPLGVATLSSTTYVFSWNTASVPNGCYVLYAQAYDSSGNVTKTSGTLVTVRNGVVAKPPRPTATFSAPLTSGVAPQDIAFSDQSTGSPTCWLWSFGDGTTAVTQNPHHIYATPGPYSVTLTAYNAGGKTSLTRANYVSISEFPRPGRRAGPTRVLLIGDSFTTQYYPTGAAVLQGLGYATATWNYPGTGLLDAGLHNSSWLDNLISLYDPDKVVMEFVGNDFNPFDPAITLDSPLYLPTWADAAITDTAKLTARGATVYWMLLPAMPSFVGFPPIDQIYDNLPTGVVDCYTPFGGGPPDMSLRVADGHLNGRGIVLMANTVASTITGTPVLRKLQVIPALASVPAGATQQFRATGTYTDGSTADLTSSVTWSSSDPGLATVDANGLATGVGVGTATVSATSGAVRGSAFMQVTPAVIASLAVDPVLASVPAGATQQFRATGTYTDGSTADLTSSVTWSSSDPSLATVDANGLATGVSVGTATISATSGAVRGSAFIQVTPAVLASLAVDPVLASVPAGATQQFRATGTYTDGSTADLTGAVSWSSGDPSVATVDANGLATGVSA